MMTGDPMFPPLVFTIWWIGLLLTLVVYVPLAVVLLHRLWRTARSIQTYAREALVAAGGIAGNTAQVGALDETIRVAGTLVTVASSVEEKLGSAAAVLARRAGRS